MSLRNIFLAATTLAVASCATDTPEAPKKKIKGVGDTVHALVQDGAREAGLGTIESRVAAGAARKFVEHPEKIEAAVNKVEDYFKEHPEKKDKLKNEARKILDGNPELQKALSGFLN